MTELTNEYGTVDFGVATLIEVDPNIPDSQHPVLRALHERIAFLEHSVESQGNTILYWQKRYNEIEKSKSAIQNSLKSVIIELHSAQEISDENAKQIFEACEVEATREVLITGTINFSGRADVSMFEEVNHSTLSYNLDVDSLDVSLYGESLSRFDYDVEDLECEEIS